MNDTGELIEWYYRRKEYTDNNKICVQCHLPFHYKPHMDFLGIKAWPSVWDRERDQRLVTWATVRQRLFRNSFYITPLKLSIKSESLGNERDVDHFMYWRKYDIKETQNMYWIVKRFSTKTRKETLNVSSYQVTKMRGQCNVINNNNK